MSDKCPYHPGISNADLANYMNFILNQKGGPTAYSLSQRQIQKISDSFPDCEYCSRIMMGWASFVSLAVESPDTVVGGRPYSRTEDAIEGFTDVAVRADIRRMMKDPAEWFRYAITMSNVHCSKSRLKKRSTK